MRKSLADRLAPRRSAPLVLAGSVLAGMPALGACQSFDLPGAIPNMVGIGVGSTTEYAGGNERMIGALPGMRYVTSGGHLIEWYGPYAQFGLGGVTGFQWGPAVSLRLGRRDVDDPVVSQVHTIDTTVEAGGYVGYEYDHSGTLPYRLRGTLTVTTNAGIVYSGTRAGLNGSAWFPLNRRIFAGVGAGATWVSSGFNRTYFGVTADDAARSGLSQYDPGGGLEQITGWLAMIYRFSERWYGGAMIYYQRISGAAAESPIVAQRGTRNQFTYGLGLAYAFKQF